VEFLNKPDDLKELNGLCAKYEREDINPIWFDRFVENWYLFHKTNRRFFNTRDDAAYVLDKALGGVEYEPSQKDMYEFLKGLGKGDVAYAIKESRICQERTNIEGRRSKEIASTNAFVLVEYIEKLYGQSAS
jgi:hypothetical protein